MASSPPGSGRPVNSHQLWMCFAFLRSGFSTFSCMAHHCSHVSTSFADLVHLDFSSSVFRSFGIVFGKHSTAWSSLSRSKSSLNSSLTGAFSLSSFFIVTLNACLVFSSTSLSKHPSSPKTSLGETSFPLGASTAAYLVLNSVGGYLPPSAPTRAISRSVAASLDLFQFKNVWSLIHSEDRI